MLFYLLLVIILIYQPSASSIQFIIPKHPGLFGWYGVAGCDMLIQNDLGNSINMKSNINYYTCDFSKDKYLNWSSTCNNQQITFNLSYPQKIYPTQTKKEITAAGLVEIVVPHCDDVTSTTDNICLFIENSGRWLNNVYYYGYNNKNCSSLIWPSYKIFEDKKISILGCNDIRYDPFRLKPEDTHLLYFEGTFNLIYYLSSDRENPQNILISKVLNIVLGVICGILLAIIAGMYCYQRKVRNYTELLLVD